MATAIRDALRHLRDPDELTGNPLMKELGGPVALAGFLLTQIEALTVVASIVDADAGWIHHNYYVRHGASHDALVARRHLSRATCFRRVDHGIGLLAAALRWIAQ